jgi:hypothetical protein
MAVAFNKFNTFVKDLGDKVHDLDADVLKIYLTNAAPSASGDAVKTDLAEITAENGYPSGGSDAQGVWTESGGVGTLATTDIVYTASGGSFGPFRYAVLYNDTPTSPADPLIGYYDYGSAITVLDGETLTVDFGATTLTIT